MPSTQSSQVSTRQLHNNLLYQIGNNTTSTDISLFSTSPPATPQETAAACLALSQLFPQMPKEFWGLATNIISKNRLSKARLEYIVEYLAEHHTYPTITLADILSVDKVCKIYSYHEFYKTFGTTQLQGYCILKQRGPDGFIQYANTEQAKQLDLEIEKHFSN